MTTANLTPLTIDYLVTWNPNTQINGSKYLDLTAKYNYYILEYFSQLDKFCQQWEINPELSPDNRLHFHGYVTFPCDKYSKRMFTKWKCKLFAHGNVKACPVYYNLCRSMEYCRKDQEVMQSKISSPVPYTRISNLETYRVFPENQLLSTLLKNAF